MIHQWLCVVCDIIGGALSAQQVEARGQGTCNGEQNIFGGQNQPQLPQDLIQPLMSGPTLSVNVALPTLQQPQPRPALLSPQEQQQQLQNAALQVLALCKSISKTNLPSALHEIDATMMLRQLDDIETCARIAKKAIRNVTVQHLSSPPAQRPCRQVRSHQLVCAFHTVGC